MRRLKYTVILICSMIGMIMGMVTGCKEGDVQNSIPDGVVKYEILLNTGSCFVYTFQDPETDVWYISTSKGIIPRLGEDGGLYNERD